MAGPTRGATEDSSKDWTPSPILARAIAAALFLFPILCAWLAVRSLGPHLYRPAGHSGTFLWIVQAGILASGVALLIDRLAQKLLPLRALLGMTLTFPDQAPSRFGIALRSSTLRKLKSKIDDFDVKKGYSHQVYATKAVELVTLLGHHDRMTRGHTDRVRAYCDMIGQELGLSADERNKLAWAAMLHDVGKLFVPAEILNKNGPPTEEEWAILQNHPAEGATLLEPMYDWMGEWLLASAQHHERWDGKGYPLGLEGAEISLAGRIVAVADAYDVITSTRSYKTAMTSESARRELVACAGHQFDPEVVRAMLNVSKRKVHTARFAWLLELPGITQVSSSLAGVPAVASLGVLAAVSGLSAAPAPQPEIVAFEAPTTTIAVEAPTDTTTDSEVGVTIPESTTPTTAFSNDSTTTLSPTTTRPTASTTQATTTSTQATTTSTQATTTTTAPPTTPASPCEQARQGLTVLLPGEDLSSCDLSGKNIDGFDGRNTDLSGADLSNTTFTNFDLTDATLTGADLRGAKFFDGSMRDLVATGANAEGIHIARVDLYNASLKNANFKNSFIEQTSFNSSNIEGAVFNGSTLQGVNFNEGSLIGAQFVGVTMVSGQIIDSNASDANFSSANMDSSEFYRTKFKRANFTNTNLADTEIGAVDFDAANLTGTDFYLANGQPVIFASATFSNTKCANGVVGNVACWS